MLRNVLLVCLAAVLIAGTFATGPAAGATVKPADQQTVYIPMLQSAYCTNGVCGRVTFGGSPNWGIPLDYAIRDGQNEVIEEGSTNADQQGNYGFTNIPSLQPGQYLYVQYRNRNQLGGLWSWTTKRLTSYYAGSNVRIGNFDTADILLVSPADGDTVSLPYTFRWTPRPATPFDSYEFDLYDPESESVYFYTDPTLGYVGEYTLNSLPANFQTGKPYFWEVWVYAPGGGFGISYNSWKVTFENRGVSAPASHQVERLRNVFDWHMLRSR